MILIRVINGMTNETSFLTYSMHATRTVNVLDDEFSDFREMLERILYEKTVEVVSGGKSRKKKVLYVDGDEVSYQKFTYLTYPS